MASLVPFLKKEDLNGMPMGLAMTLSIWPQQTHNQVIKLLAGYVLPVLLGKYHLQRLGGRWLGHEEVNMGMFTKMNIHSILVNVPVFTSS